MGAPMQPAEVAALKGADKKNPQRYPSVIPKNRDPIGEPPPHLTAAARECWREIVGIAIPGVLTAAERLQLEALAVLLAKFRAEPDKFTASMFGTLDRYCVRLGMGADTRRKLGHTPEGDEDEFDFLPERGH